MTMRGGTFNMGGLLQLNSLFFTGGTLTQTVPLTLGVASPAAALTIQQGATLGTLGRQIVLSNSGGVLFSGTTGVATINNDINLGSGTVTFDTEASGSSTLVLNGALSSGNGITVQGLDVLLFAGTAPNTYAGITTINGSTLLLGKTGGAVAIPGNVVINAGTLKLGAAGEFGAVSNMTIAGGIFDMQTFPYRCRASLSILEPCSKARVLI